MSGDPGPCTLSIGALGCMLLQGRVSLMNFQSPWLILSEETAQILPLWSWDGSTMWRLKAFRVRLWEMALDSSPPTRCLWKVGSGYSRESLGVFISLYNHTVGYSLLTDTD